jgi:hypothetical protein
VFNNQLNTEINTVSDSITTLQTTIELVGVMFNVSEDLSPFVSVPPGITLQFVVDTISYENSLVSLENILKELSKSKAHSFIV